ncbi:hypothetical protein HHI36_014075 [Cryptolaemus montrouzieri]|uniref:Uncharacterized protein n=1 Tax=Cryptolaemus montrouzieri TaxID=559131 RepID=A0ABD2N2P4_9CUCU
MKKRAEVSNKGAFSNFDFANHTLDEFMNETTYSLQDTLLFYGYNSVILNPDVTTTSKYYSKLGQCHTFQTTNSSSKFSIEGGLGFYLNNVVNGTNSVRKTIIPMYENSLMGSFKIFIHDLSEIIEDRTDQLETYSQFLHIESGESVYLTIEVKEFHMVDHSAEPCVSRINYSQSRCVEECMHNKLMQTYKCSLPWMRGNSIYPLCNDSKVIDNITTILNSERKEYSSTCNCQISCHLYFYLPNVVMREYKLHGNNTLLSIYYNTNIVSVVEQVVSYDWSSFVADLGGSFGLFLGLSVIGFMEVIEAAFRLLFKKRRERIEEEERVASLRDQRMVGRLIDYLMTYKTRNNTDVVFKDKY